MPESSVPIFISGPTYVRLVQIPEKGIVNRILRDDEQLKIVLYGLAAGHEMKLHSAPVPVLLCFVEGEATLRLGDETMTARKGGFAHMPAHLKHAIVADTAVSVLLIMIKDRGLGSTP